MNKDLKKVEQTDIHIIPLDTRLNVYHDVNPRASYTAFSSAYRRHYQFRLKYSL